MPTEYKLSDYEKEDGYGKKSFEERKKLQKEMIEMAKTRGVKPTARYYKTYPSTIRRLLKKEL